MMATHLLLVEDDQKLAEATRAFLNNHGYIVHWAMNEKRCRKILQSEPIELMILDIMLPGKSGFDICRDIRETYHIPIIMLTARSNDLDQIRGLDCGADDYIYKPVEPLVLLARIKNHLKRYQAISNSPDQVSQELIFGALTINLRSRKVTMNEEPIHLTDGEFSLLKELVINAGNIISRDELFRKIVGRPYNGSDRTIDGRISRLRKKLGDDQHNPIYIKSIRAKGYLFTGEDWVTE
ncbi:response regulator transcription factor [Kangiella shandongensis]|uniref:response regulator transcription factor n=1 Tax=Kangiella shandongensis TaxID=2763258 RepID=UPI001CC097BF|nr:response regulator transcription factor [Kangiella shandongensis]